MGAEPGPVSENQDNWPANYFNYFTEIEEHFQKARGTGLFLLSPVDWALIETWKNEAVPLEAVLRGIDAAFEKWRSRRVRIQRVNSLAYCAQAVLREARAMAGSGQPSSGRSAPPFSIEELRTYLLDNAAAVRASGQPDIGAALERIAGEIEQHYSSLEQVEQRLTALEDKMIAVARSAQTEEQLLAARLELEEQMRPYRAKMSAEQLAMLERQYLERKLLDNARLPRLSLFYMR